MCARSTFWYESAYIGNGMMGAMLTLENATCGCPLVCDPTCRCPNADGGRACVADYCDQLLCPVSDPMDPGDPNEPGFHLKNGSNGALICPAHTPACVGYSYGQHQMGSCVANGSVVQALAPRCPLPQGTGPGAAGTAKLRWDVNRVDAWADSGATMPLGHLELDTGVAWGAEDVRFTFRTQLHTATLQGNITKGGVLVLGFTAWLDASGTLEDSALRVDLFGPEAVEKAASLRWVPCFLPSNTTNRDSYRTFEVAEQCRAATATVTPAGVSVFSNDVGVAGAQPLAGNSAAGAADPPHQPCAANYNSTKPCCGQDPHEKVPVPLIDRCPAGSPTCCGYVYGQHLGFCVATARPCPPPPPPVPPPPPSPKIGCQPGNLATVLARSGNAVILATSNQCWNTTAPHGTGVLRAVARATDALGSTAAAQRVAHVAWWSHFWAESFVGISGEAATRVEAMYYVNMYRYASACRYGVHDLTAAFGPGGMTMQWGGMVWDMNIEVNLFALHSANHIGLVAPFVTAFDSVIAPTERLGKNGVLYYGNMPGPGWPLVWTLKSYWRFISDDPTVSCMHAVIVLTQPRLWCLWCHL